MRVFAGPNGSGKSTVIESVRKKRVNGTAIDFGYYINADEIALKLQGGHFNFSEFDLQLTLKEFYTIAIESGLIGANFPEPEFVSSYSLRNNILRPKTPERIEQLAQIIADVLRKMLLVSRKKFSFETVFSHPSKIDIMRQGVLAGYKVYLYFVSTESPDINVFRVQARKAKGGHDVPEQKIRERYVRSLELLYEAVQLGYRVYFFDNSVQHEDFKLFAHFKLIRDKKRWTRLRKKFFPQWFIKYYVNKIPPTAE